MTATSVRSALRAGCPNNPLVDDDKVRERERGQRGSHAKGGAKTVVLNDPAHGDRAGADARVECRQDRAKGGPAAVRRDAAHHVPDVGRIGAAKPYTEE